MEYLCFYRFNKVYVTRDKLHIFKNSQFNKVWHIYIYVYINKNNHQNQDNKPTIPIMPQDFFVPPILPLPPSSQATTDLLLL